MRPLLTTHHKSASLICELCCGGESRLLGHGEVLIFFVDTKGGTVDDEIESSVERFKNEACIAAIPFFGTLIRRDEDMARTPLSRTAFALNFCWWKVEEIEESGEGDVSIEVVKDCDRVSIVVIKPGDGSGGLLGNPINALR